MAKTRVLKYIAKAFEVEAMKFDGSYESAIRICDWVGENGQQAYISAMVDFPIVFRVVTDASSDTVSSGDYVVKRGPYEFEVCTAEYFAENYEKKEKS